MKKPHPTYDSPQGPVKDFVRFIAEDDSPICQDPFEVQVERARRSLQDGKDFLVDMGDGSGPRLASMVLEELAQPDGWRVLWHQIETNMTTSMESQTQVLRAMIAAGNDPVYDMGDGKGTRPMSAILDELDENDAFAAMVDRQVGGA